MRRRFVLVTAAALALAGAPSGVRADDDPRREARLLYAEGKFQDAEDLLRKAGPEVQNDLDLRLQLADAAQKFLKSRTGDERRVPLEAIKRNLGMVAEARPSDGATVVGAVLAAKELAEMELAKKNTGGAAAQASWALALGEKAAAAGLTPETKAALGEAYGLRASTSKKVDQADQITADYRRGAQMLEEAAAGHAKASAWLSAAADLRFREARFVHDSIPLETEKRDDEAVAAAVQLAKRACESASPAPETYTLHIRTLCAAREWKVPGDHGAPFMEPLAPAFPGLTLQVPKGVKWKRLEPTTEWLLILERQIDPLDSSVQIMLTSYSTKSAIGAKTWNDVEDGAATLYDRRKGGYGDVASEHPPALVGDKKMKGPHLFHFSMAGTLRDSSRRSKMAEWVWPSPTNRELVWDLRIVDWRANTSLEDPDLTEFVRSAVPPGLWPPGSAAPEEPKGGKKPPKKK